MHPDIHLSLLVTLLLLQGRSIDFITVLHSVSVEECPLYSLWYSEPFRSRTLLITVVECLYTITDVWLLQNHLEHAAKIHNLLLIFTNGFSSCLLAV